MEKVLIEGYEFIKIDLGGAEAIFSTAKNNLSFNKAVDKERENIYNLKKWFNIKEIGFLNQVHGDHIITYDGIIEDGDGIITNKVGRAVGVFAADCVPILLYDKTKSVVAAVHSGWRGTFSGILAKTVEKLEKEYGSKAKDLKVFVGPHIHSCCYEVGEEVKEKFSNSDFYGDKDVFKGKNLDMKKCISYQLDYKGIKEENINYLDICTFCNKEYELHSYRKNKNGGRLFAFIFLK